MKPEKSQIRKAEGSPYTMRGLYKPRSRKEIMAEREERRKRMKEGLCD